MSEWQDISLAPRDGRMILAYEPTHGIILAVREDNHWEPRNPIPDDDNFLPEYWMPLPKPPKKEHLCRVDGIEVRQIGKVFTVFDFEKGSGQVIMRSSYCPLCGEKAEINTKNPLYPSRNTNMPC